MKPPSTSADQTCGCIELSVPAQVLGEIQTGRDDSGEPLEDHEARKHAVRTLENALPVFGKQRCRAFRLARRGRH